MIYTRLTAIYGLSWSEICDMPLAAIRVYLDHIPAILAERRLIAGEGALVPHVKNYQDTLRLWAETAYGEDSMTVPATPGILKMMGIGVKHV